MAWVLNGTLFIDYIELTTINHDAATTMVLALNNGPWIRITLKWIQIQHGGGTDDLLGNFWSSETAAQTVKAVP